MISAQPPHRTPETFSKTGSSCESRANLNASGEALIDFTVSLQPGDNFRVAALLDTPGAQNHLERLHVAGTNFPFHVSAGSNVVNGFVGGVSPMLTVWRKLHLEFDSMDPPPVSGPETIYFPGTAVGITQNSPAAGRSMLRVKHMAKLCA